MMTMDMDLDDPTSKKIDLESGLGLEGYLNDDQDEEEEEDDDAQRRPVDARLRPRTSGSGIDTHSAEPKTTEQDLEREQLRHRHSGRNRERNHELDTSLDLNFTTHSTSNPCLDSDMSSTIVPAITTMISNPDPRPNPDSELNLELDPEMTELALKSALGVIDPINTIPSTTTPPSLTMADIMRSNDDDALMMQAATMSALISSGSSTWGMFSTGLPASKSWGNPLGPAVSMERTSLQETTITTDVTTSTDISPHIFGVSPTRTIPNDSTDLMDLRDGDDMADSGSSTELSNPTPSGALTGSGNRVDSAEPTHFMHSRTAGPFNSNNEGDRLGLETSTSPPVPGTSMQSIDSTQSRPLTLGIGGLATPHDSDTDTPTLDTSVVISTHPPGLATETAPNVLDDSMMDVQTTAGPIVHRPVGILDDVVDSCTSLSDPPLPFPASPSAQTVSSPNPETATSTNVNSLEVPGPSTINPITPLNPVASIDSGSPPSVINSITLFQYPTEETAESCSEPINLNDGAPAIDPELFTAGQNTTGRTESNLPGPSTNNTSFDHSPDTMPIERTTRNTRSTRQPTPISPLNQINQINQLTGRTPSSSQPPSPISAHPAPTSPPGATTANNRLNVKHLKLLQIFPDDYQDRMRQRGIRWFGINALGAYVSVYASLVRLGEEGTEGDAGSSGMGEEDGYEEPIDPTLHSLGARLEDNARPRRKKVLEAGRGSNDDTAEADGDKRKVKALEMVCEWVAGKVLGQTSEGVEDEEGEDEDGEPEEDGVSPGSRPRRPGSKAAKKSTRSTTKTKNKPFQYRLVIAAADLAWQVKQRRSRKRSEGAEEGEMGRRSRLGSELRTVTPMELVIDPALPGGSPSTSTPPGASRGPPRTIRNPPSKAPYPTFIDLDTASDDPRWPPDEREKLELGICGVLPEAGPGESIVFGRDGCLSVVQEMALVRDGEQSNSSFGKESRMFETRWNVSVKTLDNPLDPFSNVTTNRLSLPSLPPCFPTLPPAERFLAQVLQHVARSSRPDGQTRYPILRHSDRGDFAATYKANPFKRLPVLVWKKEIQPPEAGLPYIQLAKLVGVRSRVEQVDAAGVWKEVTADQGLPAGVTEVWDSAWRLTGRRVVGPKLQDVEAVLKEVAHTRAAVASHQKVASQFSSGDLPSSSPSDSLSSSNDPQVALWSAGTLDYRPPMLIGKVYTVVSGWALMGVINIPPAREGEEKAFWELGLIAADTTVALPFDVPVFFMYLSDAIILETEWSSPVYAKPLFHAIEEDTVLRPELLHTVSQMAKESHKTNTTMYNLKIIDDIIQHAFRLARLGDRRPYRGLSEKHREHIAKVQVEARKGVKRGAYDR